LVEYYDLENDEWKYDKIPEIMDGLNISDYIDPDLIEKLEALEREEEDRTRKLQALMESPDWDVCIGYLFCTTDSGSGSCPGLRLFICDVFFANNMDNRRMISLN
jgi:hypothetical protein